MRIYIVILVTLVLGSCQFRKHGEYLDYVEDYANALLDEGRDTYGTENSPLIATTLIRQTLKLPEGDSLEALLSLERERALYRDEEVKRRYIESLRKAGIE